MVNSNNNSKIKGITPKNQLQQRESHVVKAFQWAAFDDTRTINFVSPSEKIVLPSGLASGSQYMNSELSSSLVVSGVVRKGIADSWIQPITASTFSPFLDSGGGLSAVDGKSTADPFYVSGSPVQTVGEGFSQPLWSKTKIEIDMTCNGTSQHQIHNKDGTNNNYPMSYWNNVTKKYEGIGSGLNFDNFYTRTPTAASLIQILENHTIGFSHGMDAGGFPTGDTNNENLLSYGTPISNWGFPYHAKFQPTASQLVPMSSYINRPFLVEKIAYEFSGTFRCNNTNNAATSNGSISTFFILNQRKPFGTTIPNLQTIMWHAGGNATPQLTVTGANIPASYNGTLAPNTVMDLVTWMQVSVLRAVDTANFVTKLSRELNVVTSVVGVREWSGRFTMSGAVKSPVAATVISDPQNWAFDVASTDNTLIANTRVTATRSGLPIANGRDWLNSVQQNPVVNTITDPNANWSSNLLSGYSKTNPYLLLPTDNLTFGWQVPLNVQVFNSSSLYVWTYTGDGPQLSFTGPGKIVLYGSYLDHGTENHSEDSFTQMTVAVHEVIK